MPQQTLKLQVQGLTGLTISTSGTHPTEDELDDYLVDGVRDVACRILAIKPEEASMFSKTSDVINHANGTEIESGLVVGVVRANGDDATKLNPAEQISAVQRFLAKDSDSLEYRSAYNPAYYVLDKKVYIIPDPADNSNKDDAYITYVDYDTNVNHDSTSGLIANFPDKYQGLVTTYAACRSLIQAMSNVMTSISDYVSPIITNSADGSVGYDTDKDVSQISSATWTSLDYDFDGENVDYLKWFQVAGDLIQNQEDIELAKVQLDKITTYLGGYQLAMQNRGQIFDKNIQKYSTDYQWLSERHSKLYAEYIGYFNVMMGQQQAAEQAAQQAQQGRRR